MDTDKVVVGLRMIEDGIGLLATGPMDFYLKRLVAARELLLTRFAPFKVGDRVTLREPYQSAKITGWDQCKHFLIPGSPATVRGSDCTVDGRLEFDLEFDNETFFHEGVEMPATSKHVFRFTEHELEREVT